MEAGAHYTAAALQNWPYPDHAEKLQKLNDPWNGRPEELSHYDRFDRRIIPINHQYVTVVDDADYYHWKDIAWFVRSGVPTAIKKCTLIEGKTEFEYITLPETIFGGPCCHRNRHKLDNQRSNLISPETAAAGGLQSLAVLSPEAIANQRQHYASNLMTQFDLALEEYRAYLKWKEHPVGPWKGETAIRGQVRGSPSCSKGARKAEAKPKPSFSRKFYQSR